VDIDRLAELCVEPFESAKPTVFRGAISAPEDFFGAADFERIIDNPQLRRRAGLFRDKQFIAPSEFPDGYTREVIQQYRDEGVSLVLRGVQRQDGPVRDMCRALVGTGWPTVHAVAMETPPGVQALETHWDIGPTVAMQFAGRKTWYVYEPVVTSGAEVITGWTERNGRDSGQGFSNEESRRLVPEHAADVLTLEPGDVYFIPAGWPHAAAGAGVQSLHVSVCPLPQSVVDMYGNEDHFL
jgi:ribosomal protein L16 Arg81 hydroxylase